MPNEAEARELRAGIDWYVLGAAQPPARTSRRGDAAAMDLPETKALVLEHAHALDNVRTRTRLEEG
jgi:hypothetical protein